MVIMTNLEIKIKDLCLKCNGKGFIIRPPGPLSSNQNLHELIKNNQITHDQIQQIVSTPPIHIKGMTDIELHMICGYCNGSGLIEKNITLDELKNLMSS